MPHASSVASDDFASTDEVKVYKDEGEDEKRSSENLSEEKLGLLTETEEVSWPALPVARATAIFKGGSKPLIFVEVHARL